MAAIGHLSGPEWKRYPDPATELDVIRLTDPAFASGLTAPHLRQFERRTNTLLYWSERSGGRQGYQLDLKGGGSKQATEASALDPATLAFSSDDRSLFYFDGHALFEAGLPSLKGRSIYETAAGAERKGMTVAADNSVIFAEGPRIMRVSRQHAAPILETESPVDLVLARPKQNQLLWRSGDQIWLANLDGSGKTKLNLEAGRIGEILWTPNGHTVVYLHIPDDPRQLITLREYSPDEKTGAQIARTSQFATFAANSDSSVFAGASRSKASAYVLLLLRVTRRELTLCEHHASDPTMVATVFSPDSQSVFFVSDRHGKSAVYRIHVEKFVEETEG